MAIYHLSSKVISRSSGRSATAAAAYRAGEMIYDERTGLVHNYTRKQGVEESFIMAPEGAPEWVQDRSKLWNMAEAVERRKNSQACREVEVALPVELSAGEQSELVRGYVSEQFVELGMVADCNIHRPDDGTNPHAHVLLSLRDVEEDGFGEKRREWNDRALLERWREAWARDVNRDLERGGHDDRVDHRSYKEQGIDRTPSVHQGPHVTEMEERGVPTDRGTENRKIMRENFERERAREEAERLRDLEAERLRERERDDDRER